MVMILEPQTRARLDEYPPHPRTRGRILVADDDFHLVRSLKEDLELEGYEVSCAYDGMQALQMACEWRFDLIILDINMPIKSGFRVWESLRTHPDTATIPVIVISAE